VTIQNAAAVLKEGSDLFSAERVTLDLSGMEEVDSAAVSLLLEWRRNAERNGRKIEYLNLPDNLKSLAKLYGVSDLISG
jgi:phospholipid transport system transporter-binding protein